MSLDLPTLALCQSNVQMMKMTSKSISASFSDHIKSIIITQAMHCSLFFAFRALRQTFLSRKKVKSIKWLALLGCCGNIGHFLTCSFYALLNWPVWKIGRYSHMWFSVWEFCEGFDWKLSVKSHVCLENQKSKNSIQGWRLCKKPSYIDNGW